MDPLACRAALSHVQSSSSPRFCWHSVTSSCGEHAKVAPRWRSPGRCGTRATSPAHAAGTTGDSTTRRTYLQQSCVTEGQPLGLGPLTPHRQSRRCALCACLVVALTVLAGCGRVVASPSPTGVATIAVFPVDNRTGSDLYADAPPLVGILRDGPEAHRTTAADILTVELQRQLTERGFVVVTPALPRDGAEAAPVRNIEQAAQRLSASDIDAAALYVRLWIWDAAAHSHVLFVDVKLDATLVARDGSVLWQARFPAQPVDAGGASSVTLAYPAAARRVAAATLAGLTPAPYRPDPPGGEASGWRKVLDSQPFPSQTP